MIQKAFPKDPEDGTIIEIAGNVLYRYSKKNNVWTQVDGFSVSMDLATALKDGLMSSDDLQKLNGLLIPPPRTALTGDKCNFIFNSGTFGFRSSKDHLKVEYELTLRDKDGQGFDVDRKEVWQIHENTYGINFRVNVDVLLDELKKRDHITYRKTIGPTGKKGIAGKKGIDKLETGPKGLDGVDGNNFPFDGLLNQEQSGFLVGEANRGIIDIRTDHDDNSLMVTRSIIGDPELCPKLVLPKNINTKWIVAIDERPSQRIILNECSTALCANNCGPVERTLVQSFCSTRLYFIDFSAIEETIRLRFEELVMELKQVKEQITLELMKSMIDLFTEQKLALCCAVENCESRRENQRNRSIIDGARIQAAQAGFSISVDGEEKRTYIDTNPDKDCPQSEEEKQAIENEDKPPVNASSATEQETFPKYIAFTVRAIVSGDSIPLSQTVIGTSMPLTAGEYNVSLVQLDTTPCCFFTGIGVNEATYNDLLQNPQKVSPGFDQIFNKMTPYNKRFKFFWIGQDGEESFEHQDTGDFRTSSECCATSITAVPGFKFNHVGGNIRFEYTGGDHERNKFENAVIIVKTPSGTKEIPFKGAFIDSGGITMQLDAVVKVKPASLIRPECDPFDGDVSLDANLNSLKVTKQVITDKPTVLIETGILETNAVKQSISLPSAGAYDIEIVSGSIYEAKIINGKTSVPKPPVGTWFKTNDNILFFLSVNESLLPNASVTEISDPGADFFGGYLITLDMFDAAIRSDEHAFVNALKASKNLILGDDYYTGLHNPVYNLLRNFNASSLMEDVRTQLRPYNNGNISFIYTGYESEDITTTDVLVQSFSKSGGFINPDDNEEYYDGDKVRIVVGEPSVVELFYNTIDLIDPHGLITDSNVKFKLPKLSPNSGTVVINATCIPSEFTGCDKPIVTARLDCAFRTKESNALIVNLDANSYVLTVSDCCCHGRDGFAGRVALRYNDSSGSEILLTSTDLGKFATEQEARDYYIGNSFSFEHVGGDVKIWIPEAPGFNDSEQHVLEIQIQTVDCFNAVQESVSTVGSDATGDAVVPEFIPCDMSLEHINFYEFGWTSKTCCGALVDVAGVKWIIVKRSIGADITCGGGESADTDCIRNGSAFGVHPAIAFPTIDGKFFFGKPTGGFQRFFRDIDLENLIRDKILAGDVIESVNNLKDNLEIIIFPQEI